MRRVGFIPDPAPLTRIPANATADQEKPPQVNAADADAEADAAPDAEADKKPTGRKPRRKAETD